MGSRPDAHLVLISSCFLSFQFEKQKHTLFKFVATGLVVSFSSYAPNDESPSYFRGVPAGQSCRSGCCLLHSEFT